MNSSSIMLRIVLRLRFLLYSFIGSGDSRTRLIFDGGVAGNRTRLVGTMVGDVFVALHNRIVMISLLEFMDGIELRFANNFMVVIGAFVK